MTRVHVLIRATLDLDPDASEVDLEELVELLQHAAALGLAGDDDVDEVLSCAVLEILDAVDPWWGEGPGTLTGPSEGAA